MKLQFQLFAAVALSCLASDASAQFVIGHRGASHLAPENTLAAFRLAWENGADGVEGDFHLSADGQIVCIHDFDTERVAGKKLIVADSTLAELRALDVGSWKDKQYQGEKIPTLTEVIETIPPGKKLFIELKVGPEIIEPLQKVLDDVGIDPEQIVIISFNEQAIEACEKLMPHLRSHWLTGYKQADDGQWRPTAAEVIETIQRTGADGLGSNARSEYFDKNFIKTLFDSGQDEFHVWTVNELDVAKQYKNLGAWSITTDRPGWLRRELHGTAAAVAP